MNFLVKHLAGMNINLFRKLFNPLEIILIRSQIIRSKVSYKRTFTMNPKTPEEDAYIILKNPKGMKDISPDKGWERRRIFNIITDCFERHGALPLDTPVCERREILLGKYGEDSKLIYNLEDQGGEALSLRYDLTVPFARYLGQNKIQAMTRYQIAKVYRRDQPAIAKGRFREFYQCDLDFAGKYENMLADSECLEILCEILSAVKLPFNFSIKINHRLILDGFFRLAGVPGNKFKQICSAIDKLDKTPWEEVKREMIQEKGLDQSVADALGKFVSRSGSEELIDELLHSDLGKDDNAKKGLEDLKILYSNAQLMNFSKYLSFDLSLARGLDYYTGLIFEAVISDKNLEVGSIAAGGRYDNLVSTLVENPNFHVPCVGLSVGIERLFAIIESQTNQEAELGANRIHCCVASIGKGMSEARYKIVRDLRDSGLRVKNFLKTSVKPLNLYQQCEKDNAPYGVFFGPEDLKNNNVCLRNMSKRQDEKIPIDSLAEELNKRLGLR